MNILRGFCVTALTCCALAFLACSANESAGKTAENQPIGNLSEKLVGKWIHAETDGAPVLTNQKSVRTFALEDSVMKVYNSMALNDVGAWWEHKKNMDIAIDGNRIILKAKYDNGKSVTTEMMVTAITDKDMRFDAKTTLFNDGEAYAEIAPRHERFVRIEKDYSQEILGVWEGHVTSEQSAYDDHKQHRWEYRDDGTYSYMGLTEDGEWEDDVNSKGDYFVDGNLLCTRWKNVGDSTEHREWWEIESIENDVMNWTALRKSENDSLYTATFSMHRVQ